MSDSPSDYQLNGGLPERLLARSLLDAPCVLGAEGLGMATAAVVPWPHQLLVSQVLVERFPERFLLADEVGLGKTIEVGLALRQLVLSQQVQRAVLLVPHSVLRQWQGELYEKFCLDVPRYDMRMGTCGRCGTSDANQGIQGTRLLANRSCSSRVSWRNGLTRGSSFSGCWPVGSGRGR